MQKLVLFLFLEQKASPFPSSALCIFQISVDRSSSQTGTSDLPLEGQRPPPSSLCLIRLFRSFIAMISTCNYLACLFTCFFFLSPYLFVSCLPHCNVSSMMAVNLSWASSNILRGTSYRFFQAEIL